MLAPVVKKKNRIFVVTKIRDGLQGFYLNYKNVKFTRYVEYSGFEFSIERRSNANN